MPEFTYEIVESVAVLSENPKGWTKELNLISWNGRDPKYDIREWAPDHEKMGKGVTLSKDEMAALQEAVNSVLEDLIADGSVQEIVDKYITAE